MRTRFIALVASLLLLSPAAFAEVSKLTIDTDQSTIGWLGKKVVGQHNGIVKVGKGTVELTDGVVSGGEFEIDMSTITNIDMKGTKDQAKLEGHLKSDDFFNVEKFPIGKFTISDVTSKADDGSKVVIKGMLTVKGISAPLEFPATISQQGDVYKARAEVTIDRSKWDIRYNSPSFFDPKKLGDKLIYNDIKIDLDLTAKESA